MESLRPPSGLRTGCWDSLERQPRKRRMASPSGGTILGGFKPPAAVPSGSAGLSLRLAVILHFSGGLRRGGPGSGVTGCQAQDNGGQSQSGKEVDEFSHAVHPFCTSHATIPPPGCGSMLQGVRVLFI